MWTLSLITPPASEALDTSPGGEVYQHLRLEPELTPQDSLIQSYAAAARQEGERIARRQFITATWELWMDSWFQDWIGQEPWSRPWTDWPGNGICLPLPPLQSVTSVKYLDGAGAEQTWSSAEYTVEAPAGDFAQKGRIYLKSGFSWPSSTSIKIRYVCGYGATPATVPALFRSAMLLTVGEAYESRELQSVGTSAVRNPRAAKNIFFDNRAW